MTQWPPRSGACQSAADCSAQLTCASADELAAARSDGGAGFSSHDHGRCDQTVLGPYSFVAYSTDQAEADGGTGHCVGRARYVSYTDYSRFTDWKDTSGDFECSAGYFGADPHPDSRKWCQCDDDWSEQQAEEGVFFCGNQNSGLCRCPGDIRYISFSDHNKANGWEDAGFDCTDGRGDPDGGQPKWCQCRPNDIDSYLQDNCGPPPPPPPPETDSRGHNSDFECVSCIISCRSGIDADPTLPSGVYSVCALNGSPAYDVFCRARALPLKQSSPWCCLGDHL
jgi:hypothetical protein